MLQRGRGGVHQATRVGTKKYIQSQVLSGHGAVQLPGVIKQDLSDGKRVLELLADMLGVPHPSSMAVSIKMLNYNFRVQFGSEDECLNLAEKG